MPTSTSRRSGRNWPHATSDPAQTRARRGRAELDAVVDWYADKRPILAVEFLDAVEAGIARVLDWPDSGRPYPGREDRTPVLRMTRVKGFPYSIVYLVDGDDLVLFAYPHDKQRPGYWKRRLDA